MVLGVLPQLHFTIDLIDPQVCSVVISSFRVHNSDRHTQNVVEPLIKVKSKPLKVSSYENDKLKAELHARVVPDSASIKSLKDLGMVVPSTSPFNSSIKKLNLGE